MFIFGVYISVPSLLYSAVCVSVKLLFMLLYTLLFMLQPVIQGRVSVTVYLHVHVQFTDI